MDPAGRAGSGHGVRGPGPGAAAPQRGAARRDPCGRTLEEAAYRAAVLAASTAADWRALDPSNTLYLELPSGRVVIELAAQFAPHHVANVQALAHGHYFDGLWIMRAQDNYVVQWGDPGRQEARRRSAPHRGALSSSARCGVSRSRGFRIRIPMRRKSDSWIPFRSPPIRRSARVLVHCYGMVGAGRDKRCR